MDIEDLINYGKENTTCPFYTSRENQGSADIVFLPYNYLIDSQTREAQSLDLTNSIVIFDEAHNLESFCEESYSFELTLSDIKQAIIEMEHCLIKLRTENETEFGLGEYNALKWIQTQSGKYMYELFQSIEIDYSNASNLSLLVDGAITVLSGTGYKSKNIARYGLALFNDALKLLYKVLEKDTSVIEFYRVHIERKDTVVAEQFAPVKKLETVLSFWCFSAQVAMKSLQALGTRTIILASGTLSPLESIPKETGILFPYKVENAHVIKHTQILVNVLQKGPSGVELNSSFSKRDSREYIHDLGLSIVNIAKVTPKGILVFFTSYALLKKTIDAWERITKSGRNSIIGLMEQHKKVYVEPKSKLEFVRVIEKFNNSVKHSGAILFAVCRGKASEGIDFSDDHCRAVLICGIPFPALKDPKVELKKKILSINNRKGGDEWYSQQAYRAVNQAIGRVIRHRKDYGAIILLDDRFSNATVQKNLPVWIRHHIEVVKEYGQLNTNLQRFFRNIGQLGLDYSSDLAVNQKKSNENVGTRLVRDYDLERYYDRNDPLSVNFNDIAVNGKYVSIKDSYKGLTNTAMKSNEQHNSSDPLSIPAKSTHHARFEIDKTDPMYVSPKKYNQSASIYASDALSVMPKKVTSTFPASGDPLHINIKAWDESNNISDNPLNFKLPEDPLAIKQSSIATRKHVAIEYTASNNPLEVSKTYLSQKKESPLNSNLNESSCEQTSSVKEESENVQPGKNIPTVNTSKRRTKYKGFQSCLKNYKMKKEIDLLEFVTRVCKLITEIQPPFDANDIACRIELLEEFQKFAREQKNEVKKELAKFKDRYGHKII
ncbi:hypothetical protein HK103_006534 [Boothiomyces macroporosus]|uniref:Regulator of telomere elongation helicase 1 homolog n=1 Tax=Boothiomyces macroporosus TaxID=261099 RepID=A0AAD5UGT2_9FUNG|nr:hypothetical protein HK103_006534 [Boothiomyces macroporosus]